MATTDDDDDDRTRARQELRRCMALLRQRVGLFPREYVLLFVDAVESYLRAEQTGRDRTTSPGASPGSLEYSAMEYRGATMPPKLWKGRT